MTRQYFSELKINFIIFFQKREEERIAGIKIELAQVEADIKKVIKSLEEAGERSDVTASLQLMQQNEILQQSRLSLITVSDYFILVWTRSNNKLIFSFIYVKRI